MITTTRIRTTTTIFVALGDPEMEMGQWVKWVTIFGWVSGSWVTVIDLLTHDNKITAQ